MRVPKSAILSSLDAAIRVLPHGHEHDFSAASASNMFDCFRGCGHAEDTHAKNSHPQIRPAVSCEKENLAVQEDLGGAASR